ncbi:MAG: VOC family protein [Sphingobium sp.]
MIEQSAVANEMRRPDVLGVHSMDHFAFTVPDLSEAAAFYATFGLDVRAEGDAVGLYTFGNSHRWAVLREGNRKKFDYLSFGIYEDEVDQFRSRLRQLNIPIVAAPSRGESDGVWFHDEDGNRVEVAVKPRSSPIQKAVFGKDDFTGPAGVAACPSRRDVASVKPRRLSHVAIYTTDVSKKIEFYTKVLGMRLSDRSGDFCAFLHGPHGSEHHMFAFVKSGGSGFHHCSWDVGSINDVGLGAEQMQEGGYHKGWGLGRHVVGSNYFYYATDPWGSHTEYSADMDYIPADCDWQAKDYALDDRFTLWGGEPPKDFGRNFEIE